MTLGKRRTLALKNRPVQMRPVACYLREFQMLILLSIFRNYKSWLRIELLKKNLQRVFVYFKNHSANEYVELKKYLIFSLNCIIIFIHSMLSRFRAKKARCIFMRGAALSQRNVAKGTGNNYN